MADKYEDRPSNQGVKGAKKGISTYFGDFAEGSAKSFQKGNALIVPGTMMAIGGAIFGGGAFLIDHNVEMGRDYSAASDTAIVQGLEHQNGYAAVSNNGGESGYVLLRDGEDYELYRFSKLDADGDYQLTFEAQNDDAWRVMRALQQDYRAMIDAASDPNADLPSNPYEMFVFDSISKPYEVDGEITRLGEGLSEFDVTNISQNLQAQNEAWSKAAQEVFEDANYGFEAGEFEAEKTDLEFESIKEYGLSSFLLGVAAGGFLMAGVGTAGGGVAHANRRRRERKRGLNP